MSKNAVVVAVVLGVVALGASASLEVAFAEAGRQDAAVDQAAQAIALAFLVVAVAAAVNALRGESDAAPSVLLAATAVLCSALLNGFGEWATPLALAACAVAPCFARRRCPPERDAPAASHGGP